MITCEKQNGTLFDMLKKIKKVPCLVCLKKKKYLVSYVKKKKHLVSYVKKPRKVPCLIC